jgi:isopentenyl-diphosphate delta-isomerase
MNDALSSRKDAHLDVVLNKPVAALPQATGLGGWRLEYDGLPELDLKDVDLSTTILGRPLRAPIIIGAMTGGTERASQINHTLARAAARVGVGMALGSQRTMLVNPSTRASFAVRDAVPDLPLLFGNIGAVQLNYGVTVEQLAQMAADTQLDALNVHLNPLQEAIQPEGDTRFRGLIDAWAQAIPSLPIPCIVKEVGAGISARTAAKLAPLPIAGVEAAGVGGTSWAAVESYRTAEGTAQSVVGRRLAGFGVPTDRSIQICRHAFPDRLVIGSGGLRTGMDAAIGLALGSDAVALAKPLLEAAVDGEDAVVHALETLILELRVICFCTGARNLAELRAVRRIPPGGQYPLAAPALKVDHE